MRVEANSDLEAIEQFREKLSASLADGTFVRLVLSGPQTADNQPEKILGRCIDLRGVPHLSFTLRFPTRDEVQNLDVGAAVDWVIARLKSGFKNGLLCTTNADWQLSAAPDQSAKLIRHKPSATSAPSRQHDRTRRSLLDRSAQDWLRRLRVTDAQGRVRPGMGDKHAQIQRYLEIFTHLAKDAQLTSGEWTIADMGCGKGYLTFGLWHLLRRVWGWPVSLIGVEARPELAASTSLVAQNIGAEGLQFMAGTIESTPLPKIRALIALHACDTATDAALRRGIELGADLILLAPCCQKELRPQMAHAGPLAPVLRHGIMEERMAEWLTDGLRALFLEWAGYRTKIFEFVASEHTAKNVMIAAVRERPPFQDEKIVEQILALKQFFGIKEHSLDGLLPENSNRP